MKRKICVPRTSVRHFFNVDDGVTKMVAIFFCPRT